MNTPLQNTWVLIADAETATVYQHQGPSHPLQKLAAKHQPTQPSREIAQNKRGRNQDGVGPHRSAYEETTDPHEYQKQNLPKV